MVFKPFKGHFLYSGARSSSGGGCMRGAGCWYFVIWKCVKKGYSSGRIDLPVPPNCLSIIITGTYFSPFQGVLHLSRGLSKAPQPYFCIILEFWIIFLIYWMNFSIDYLLNEYLFEWIFSIKFWKESDLIQCKNKFSKQIAYPYSKTIASQSYSSHKTSLRGQILRPKDTVWKLQGQY